MTKSSLLALTNALQRALAASIGLSLAVGFDTDAPPLVVAFFQRRSYFAQESVRFGALGALGVTTIVGYPGEAGELPPAVVHVDLAGRSELDDAWVLAVFDGALGAVLVAVDDKGLVDGPTLEGSRRFVVRWTVRAPEARAALRQLLAPLRPRLDRRVLALVESALARNELAPENDAAPWLRTLVDELAPQFEIAPLTTRRDAVAEVDLLTGVRNRTFLERYLPRVTESAAEMAAILIDVDNLGVLNERLGLAAGDAALVGVARALAAECRPGDVLVRNGDDEFLLLATVDGTEGAAALARRLVVAARAARLDYPFEAETVTISIGACLTDPAVIPLERLREALREAKVLGKNVARLAE